MNDATETMLAELHKLHGWGRNRLSKETGIPPATVQRFLKRHELAQKTVTASREKILEKIGRSNIRDEDLSAILNSSKIGNTTNTHTINWGGDSARLLVFSDTHIGNKVFKDNWWWSMWEAADKYNCDMALFAGDLLEGPPIRSGHIYECSEIGWEAQKSKAISLMKDVPIPIKGVMGNHDLWYMQNGNTGINPGKEISEAVECYDHLGDHFADVKIGTLTIGLHHGLDGASYALGYRSQKIIESIPGGDKPHVLITGHDHKQGFFDYRNVQAIAAGTLCPQTKWMRGKRIQAACGFWIVDLEWNSEGLESITPRWFPLYK